MLKVNQKGLLHTVCPISSGSYEHSVLGKIRKSMKRGNCCKSRVSCLKFWNFSPWTSRYGATLFTSTIVRSYGSVATLTGQFATRRGFSGFVCFLFPVVPVSPLLLLPPALEIHPPFTERHPSFAGMPTWQHRRNLLLIM
jgi:hypothetical protein